MAEDIQQPCQRWEERNRSLDWLTALLPPLLISWIYYRFAAVLLELLAIGGYLMAARLLARTNTVSLSPVPAVVTGLLVAFCLPSTTPYWPAALAGGVAAVAAALPGLLYRRWPDSSVSRPLLQPALVGYLVVRWLFPSTVSTFSMPALWSGVDGLSVATPLAAFWGEELLLDTQHLLFGIRAGALGEVCAVAVLLSAAYLLLRRRLRVVAPLCLLGTVSLLSLCVWNSPLYGVLAGGTLLGALLLADRAIAPVHWHEQAIVGILAGVVIVVCRRLAGVDGTAVAVLLAGGIQPVLPFVYRGCAYIWPHICRGALWVYAGLRRWVFPWFCAAWKWFVMKIYKKQK